MLWSSPDPLSFESFTGVPSPCPCAPGPSPCPCAPALFFLLPPGAGETEVEDGAVIGSLDPICGSCCVVVVVLVVVVALWLLLIVVVVVVQERGMFRR